MSSKLSLHAKILPIGKVSDGPLARPVSRKAILAMPTVTVHYDRQRDGEDHRF